MSLVKKIGTTNDGDTVYAINERLAITEFAELLTIESDGELKTLSGELAFYGVALEQIDGSVTIQEIKNYFYDKRNIELDGHIVNMEKLTIDSTPFEITENPSDDTLKIQYKSSYLIFDEESEIVDSYFENDHDEEMLLTIDGAYMDEAENFIPFEVVDKLL